MRKNNKNIKSTMKPPTPAAQPATKPATSPAGQFVTRTVKNIRQIDNFTPALNTLRYKTYFNFTDRDFLTDVSRELYTNHSLYRAVINTIVSLAIGQDGFQLNVSTKNEELNTKIQNYMYDFFLNPEVSGRYISKAFEKEIFQEYFITGEIFLYKTNDGLQIIYSEEVQKINYNDVGKLESIEIKAEKGKPGTVINAKNLIYKIAHEATSPRGFPLLTSAITLLLRMSGIMEAEAFGWQLASRVPLAIKRDGGGAGEFLNAGGDQSRQPAATRELLLDYGLIFSCDTNETIEGVHRTAPIMHLSESLTAFLRVATSVTQIPAELFLNDLSAYNYSQARLLIDRAKSAIKDIQNEFIYSVYNHITTYVINKMKKDNILSEDMFTTYATRNTIQWKAEIPFSSYMERQEIQNQVEQIKYGLSTHSDIISSRYGKDRKELLDARVVEIKDALTRIAEINKEFGINLSPDLLLGCESTSIINESNQNIKE